MGSLETQFLALETTVGPVPVLESLALITLTDTLVTLTTALTRSSVTAKKATLVMIYYFLKLFFEDHLFIISISLIFNFVFFSFSPRLPLWPVCPWLLRKPRAAWWPVPAMWVPWKHRHRGSWFMWPQDRSVPKVSASYWRSLLWAMSTRLLWQRCQSRLQT